MRDSGFKPVGQMRCAAVEAARFVDWSAKMRLSRRTVVTAALALALSMSCVGSVAWAQTSSSFGGSANHYSFYTIAETKFKQVTGKVHVDVNRLTDRLCIGASPRIYIASSGALKASGGTKYNPAIIPARNAWVHAVTADSVAGISYYAKGTFYFGGPGSYYSRDAGTTGNVKHQNN